MLQTGKRWLLMLLIVGAVSGVCAKEVSYRDYKIVVPDQPKTWEKLAAIELQNFLEKASGVRLQVIAEKEMKTGKAIYLGDTQSARKAGVVADKLEAQEFVLKSAAPGLFIVGGSPSGTIYGAYELLDRFGVRFLAPDCTVVAPNRTLTLDKAPDCRKKPAFETREIYHGQFNAKILPAAKVRWEDYGRRNRVPTHRDDQKGPGERISYAPKAVCHSFYEYVPPAKYFKTNPEYFSMNPEGRRAYLPSGQLCFTNPGVRKVMLESLRKFIAEDRAKYPENYPTLYDFSQEDNTNYICKCPECVKVSARYGSDAGLVLEFLNGVAREIRKEYPDVYLRTFAYCSTEVLPRELKVEPNIIIWLCDLYSVSNHNYPLESAVNQKRAQVIKDWQTLADGRIHLWDYVLDAGETPYTAVDALGPDVRFMHKHGVRRIFVESYFRPYRSGSFCMLRLYVQSRLFFDPSLDTEKLIDDFMKGYYGKAAPAMTEYLTLLRDAQKKHVTSDMGAWHNRVLKHASSDFLLRSRAIVAKTFAQAAGDAVSAGRIGRELAVIDYALIGMFRNMARPPVPLKELIAEYDRAMRAAISYLDDRESVRKELLEQHAGEVHMFTVRFNDLPPELAGLDSSDLKSFGYPAFPYGHEDAKRVRDEKSTMPLSLAFLPSDPTRHKLPWTMGCYDGGTKNAISIRLKNVAQDEKYHWVKIGRFKFGPQSRIFAPGSWHMGIPGVASVFVPTDGIPDDRNPNIYDAWVSIRFAGPVYVKNSTSPNAVYIDRVALARPSELRSAMNAK